MTELTPQELAIAKPSSLDDFLRKFNQFCLSKSSLEHKEGSPELKAVLESKGLTPESLLLALQAYTFNSDLDRSGTERVRLAMVLECVDDSVLLRKIFTAAKNCFAEASFPGDFRRFGAIAADVADRIQKLPQDEDLGNLSVADDWRMGFPFDNEDL